MLQVEAKNQNGATAGDFQLANGADFACPLTGLPMNGRYRFSVLRKTGHVLSEKALKEVSSHITHRLCWTGIVPCNTCLCTQAMLQPLASCFQILIAQQNGRGGDSALIKAKLGIGCPGSCLLGSCVESSWLLRRFQLLWRRWWEDPGLQRTSCL